MQTSITFLVRVKYEEQGVVMEDEEYQGPEAT